MSGVFRVGFLCFLLQVTADPPTTAPAGKQELRLELGGGIALELVLVQPGSFVMGSDKGEDDEKPARKVTLTKPFYIGKFEVTQEQWQAVMGENPSQFRGAKHPVDGVSWDDSQVFLQRLSEKLAGGTVRLPTEAEWEYTCRAGSSTAYSHGEDAVRLGEYGWFKDNSGAQSHPVGQKRPNAWGLFDMHGNVCEWCADWYGSGSYAAGKTVDPDGPDAGDARVLRGESWVSTADTLRSAYRVGTPPEYRNSHVGLRIVYEPKKSAE